MEFWCFDILDTDPMANEPIGYVAVQGEGIFKGTTLAQCKEKVLASFPRATFRENCGWIFPGEEEKLLDPDYKGLIEYTEQLRNAPKDDV